MPPPGSQLSPSRNMAFHYMGLLSIMPWLCDADGNLPSKCDCGNRFTVEHALSCAKGSFPSIRHNEIRDLMANLLTEVCSEVCIEPNLQPTTTDQLSGPTANSQDGARLSKWSVQWEI